MGMSVSYMQEKFYSLGYDSQFILIGRLGEGRQIGAECFSAKCKICGFESTFRKDNLNGRISRLICRHCGIATDGSIYLADGSSKAKELAEYYTQGHSVDETAEKFGIPTSQVNSFVKRQKITNGRSFQGFHGYHGCVIENKKRSEEAEQRLAIALPYLGFDYLGGYETSQGKCRIKCRACGSEYERTYSFLRKGNVICVECQKRETKERQAELKRKAEERKAERDLYRLMHPPKDAYAELHESFLSRSGICEICGKPYTVRDYVESCGLKKAQDNGVCSAECCRVKKNKNVRESRKKRGVQDSHRHRARKYGCEYEPGITLKKLVARDGLQCRICGKMCDWNDRSWTKYSGPLYPSIDHIIPMSKRGGHTWKNVQVAHIMCNSEKGDRLEVTGE